MFPTVGLYLPGTIQGNMHSAMDLPERKRPKRRLMDRKSFDRSSFARKSSDNIDNRLTSISTALNFADFVTGLSEASSEIRSLVNVIQQVREDISIASRLRASRQVVEYCRPEERSWIDNVLRNVQEALNDIGVYVEDVRVSGDEGGTVGMRQKFEWVLSHHDKIRDRQPALVLFHQSLSTTISFMHTVEMGGQLQDYAEVESEGISMIYEAPAMPWMGSEHGLRGPYMRQKYRLSQRNLSLPSIDVSHPDEDKAEVYSVNSEPAELPGSTPEDLPHPDNLDLYSDDLGTTKKTRPLSTVTERANSTAESNVGRSGSNHASTIPMARYRAKRVHVPPSPGRHRSLPTQLPNIPQTQSLVAELTAWVADYNFELGNDSNEPVSIDTPSTSATSSPTVRTSAASCPERVQSFSSATTASSSVPNADGNSPAKQSSRSIPIEDSPTLPQDSLAIQKTEGESKGHSLQTSLPAIQESRTQDTATTEATEATEPAKTEISAASHTKDPTSADATPTSTNTEPDTDEEKPPPLPPRPPQDVVDTMLATLSQEKPKPLTSQAKRRMAHARRMQRAYGSEEDI